MNVKLMKNLFDYKMFVCYRMSYFCLHRSYTLVNRVIIVQNRIKTNSIIEKYNRNNVKRTPST